MDLTSLLNLPPQGLVVFLLVLVRTSSIFLTAPILGNSNVPMQLKIGLSLLMAIIFTPLLLHQPLAVDVSSFWAIAIAVLQEITVGVLIGLLAQLVFVSFQIAGQFVGMQMGFGMASVFDPTFRTQIAVTAQFYLFAGTLVFLILDGHHWVLIALQRSFQAYPLATFHLDGRAIAMLIQSSNDMFWSALTLMAPVLGVLALAEIAIALVARIMPQMNVFVASFPVKIGLGILTMALGFTMAIAYMGTMTESTFMGLLKFLAS